MDNGSHLLDSQEICLAIYQHSTEAILVVDHKGVICHANPRALDLFGYSFDELMNQKIEILIPKSARGVHKDHVKKYTGNARPRAMAEGLDLKGQRKDGSLFSVSISLSPAEVDGQTMVVALVVDITERVHVQQRLKKHNLELEKRVKDRTQELATMVNTLEKSNKDLQKAETEVRKALSQEKELNELKSRFVSMASHEFRTPLSTILSSVALLEKYAAPEHAEKREKHFGRVRSNIKHLTSILNDFLSLDKLQQNTVEMNPESVDLKELFEELKEELEMGKKQGQTIELDVPDNLVIFLDRNVLKNAFINLGSNAIKYSQEDKTIQLKAKKLKTKVEISIIDLGIGIPEADQKRLFERFFRATNATNIQGTGLGLHLVQRYVELLGGKVQFQSEYMEGTTFTVTLPLNEY